MPTNPSIPIGTTMNNETTLALHSNTELIYITDTLCGWCNIAKLIVEQLFEKYHEQFPFTLLHRRLFVDDNILVMDDPFLQKVRRIGWPRSPQMTGRTFTEAYFNLIQQEGFQHESHMTALAVAAAASFLDRDGVTRFAGRLMQLVFDDGRDPNTYSLFEQAAVEFGIDADKFEQEFSAETTLEKALADSQLAIEIQSIIGSQGVPALVLRQGNQLTKLAPYNFDQAVANIENSLAAVVNAA